MRRIFFGFFIAAVAGCSHQDTEVDRVINDALASPLVAQTIFREGDTLNFQVMSARAWSDGITRTAQIEANCEASSASIVYADDPKRVYVGRTSIYAKPLPVPARDLPTLAKNPGFITACASIPRPDWRVVAAEDPNSWVLIDRNSLKTQGNEIQVWAAFDAAAILSDLPYNAPYAQKRERYAFDCTRQTYRRLVGYDVDADNHVTDGDVHLKAAHRPIPDSDKQLRLIYARTCDSPEALGQLPVFVPRAKAVVPVILPSIQPGVLSSIQQLRLPKSPRSLSRLVITGTTTFDEGDGGKPVIRKLSISEDAASEQLKIIEHSSSDITEISWRGLFTIVRHTNFGSGVTDTLSLSSVTFKGDWQNMPLNAHISYALLEEPFMTLVGVLPKRLRTIDCTIVRDLHAAELNKDLLGSAKALTCSSEDDAYKRVDHYYYLMDYGFFFHAGTDKNVYFYENYSLQSVQ